MKSLAGILALLIGVAGWYYLFYSKAALRLSGLENPGINLRRRWLRRVNGFMMLLLAVLFYAGFYGVEDQQSPQAFVLVWIGVMALLFVIVFLAVADLRLTAKLRQKR